jgi:hypothetical protein
MKKETITAIIFGIIMGSVLGIFLISKNKRDQLNKTKVIAPTTIINQKTKAIEINTQVLEITQPQDKEIVYKNIITIKGNITKNSLIIIQSPIKDTVINSEKEQFSTDFPLALGENVIRISVYPNDKTLRTQEKEIRIYYFPEQL